MEEVKKVNVVKRFLRYLKKAVCNIVTNLFYDADGNFSTRKLMNLSFFLLAVFTAFVGIYVKIKFGKELPVPLYTFVGSLCGGGFLQYAYKDTLATKRLSIGGVADAISGDAPIEEQKAVQP